MRCFGCISVYLCTSSLQIFAVPQYSFSLSVSLLTDLTDPVFDRVGLASFETKANAFSLAGDACSPFSSTVFRLSTFSL